MPDLLKKISLDTSPPPKAAGTGPFRQSNSKRRFSWNVIFLPLGVILLVVLVIGILLLPIRGVISAARETIAAGKELGSAAKNQDLDRAKAGLANTRVKLTTLSDEYKKIAVLKAIPILGSYIADGEHGINAAFAGLGAGDKAIEALEPNADLLGLKGKSKFVSGTADERLQTAVKTMSALTPKINEMATYIDTLRKEVDAIDPNRYPRKVGNTVVREKIIQAKDVIENAANLFVNAQPLLVNLPKLLGDQEEKRYLVLFQNDKELRPTGGFITAYAQFRLVKGKAILEKADDIYALDGTKKKNFPAPREILTFHKGVYNLNIRDSNLSPDFKLSMKQFEELYDTTSSKEKIDGIWAVDTHVLVEALKILGAVHVYGREFSADTDKRCDCPKAVYELEDYSTRPVGYVRDARKDIIGVLLQTLLQKALGISPSKYWGQLFQMLLAQINEKHVLAYFHDTDAQKAAESFNLAGRIMMATETATLLTYQEGKGWDYLHINNSNMAGAKANMFVSEKVSKDVTVNSDGTLMTKLTLEYKDPYPGSDCGLESGGLCLNAPLRNWVRVYVPSGSKLADSKGTQSPKDNKPVGMDTYDSLGKTVFEGFLIVNPLGTA
ncbi:DUF4012 domain-containing protein, partial [Candidatus Gottesmanbacteria bacterium]|nr:DUF4012 domain-containing protein [Candidatus Gottesmanbacteria bacterium]